MDDMHHLPRLDRKFYQSFAVVHWTITFEDRSTGWLDEAFTLSFVNFCSMPPRGRDCSAPPTA